MKSSHRGPVLLKTTLSLKVFINFTFILLIFISLYLTQDV